LQPGDDVAVGTVGVRHPERELAWVENAPSSGWFPRLDARELWRERELALVLALKDLKVRYKQTFFGVAWAVLQPLVAVVIFSLLLGRAAGLPSGGIPYPVFSYTGLVVWLYFSAATSAAAQSLVDNRELVTKVYFPRLLAPLAAMLPGLVDVAVSLPIIGIFLAVWSVAPSYQLLLLPAWVVAALLTALGVGLLLAALNVRYRDVRYLLPFLLQVWFFASPIVYTGSVVSGGWRYLYAVNPMVTTVTGFRWSIAGGRPPGLEALVSLAIVCALLVVGFVYFRRVERSFADAI